ncbi:hypothetical protein [Photobacterium galatheae]|uniref:Lipoprotein n=1 Tax=Photobacterium galatheae TaxID=1654360 RepID=A0A066RUU3_9GAMM|nr:hypothetical protein [Photobacterium galatheae]KDM92886.1 hypothetical protein EA58_03785 [Photobacterium galatheae]MCM0148149.1 hypothetical protein [Photobacterium galatheae]
MKLKSAQWILILTASASLLAGCQLTGKTSVSCKPVAPQLEWYTTPDGGVYYPKQSFTNLNLYIEALNMCVGEYYIGL